MAIDDMSHNAILKGKRQKVKKELIYDTGRTDLYDRLQPDDLKQISVIVASFVYDAAMRDQMLPRKPIEKPLPKEPEKKEE
jgi:hypothetical protein